MSELDPLFAALGDPNRRLILERLARQGAASASALAGEFPISRQGLAKHLGLLERAGLVSREREGREAVYSFVPDALAAVDGWSRSVAEQWDNRLARLAKLTESPDGLSAAG